MSKKFISFVGTLIIRGMKMVKNYAIKKTQSLDGELHFILCELKLDDAPSEKCDLDRSQIKEIMKKEAQKPLLLSRN